MMRQNFCVSAAHPIAAELAADVLRDGGNAVDAGVAACIALCVLHCEQVQLGGIAPMMLRMADEGRVHVLDGVGRWPARTDPELFRSQYRSRIPFGILRSVVPAAPAAWIMALRRFGTRGLAELAAPAARLAAEGFAVPAEMATLVGGMARYFAAFEGNRNIWMPGGKAPVPGEMIRFPDLAETLRALIEADRAGAARGGRMAGLDAAEALFYRGEIAERMLRHVADEGGWIEANDLAAHRCRVEAPVAAAVPGGTLFTCGPWSQGPTLALALRIHASWRARHGRLDGTSDLHALTCALDLAMADREAWFGDPDFVDVPLAALLSDAQVARRAEMIDPDRAFGRLPPASADAERWPGSDEIDHATCDTSIAAVVDGAGNVFAATPSDGAADGPVVPGLGFVISTRGSQSHSEAGHPAVAAPGRRPRVTACPMMHIGPDGRILAGGGPGGDRQLAAMAQVLLWHLGRGEPLERALAAPRVFSQSAPASTSPHFFVAGRLEVEEAFDPAGVAELAARGHKIQPMARTDVNTASVCLVATGPAGLEAVGDPRLTSGQIVEQTGISG
jgi:gamma-glutamyltranspeptidase/glutathione hydrolase